MLLHRASRRLRARLDSRLDRSDSRAMESLRRGSERANEKRGQCFVFFFFFASASTEKTKAPSAVLVACLREYGHLWNPHGVFGKVFGLIRTIFTDRTRGTARENERAKNVRPKRLTHQFASGYGVVNNLRKNSCLRFSSRAPRECRLRSTPAEAISLSQRL